MNTDSTLAAVLSAILTAIYLVVKVIYELECENNKKFVNGKEM